MALYFRDHDNIQNVSRLENHFGNIVQNPRAIERIDAGPATGLAEVVVLHDLNESAPRIFLRIRRNRVFEVTQQNIYLLKHPWHTLAHFRVMWRQKMDHALQLGPGGHARALARPRRGAGRKK